MNHGIRTNKKNLVIQSPRQTLHVNPPLSQGIILAFFMTPLETFEYLIRSSCFTLREHHCSKNSASWPLSPSVETRGRLTSQPEDPLTVQPQLFSILIVNFRIWFPICLHFTLHQSSGYLTAQITLLLRCHFYYFFFLLFFASRMPFRRRSCHQHC